MLILSRSLLRRVAWAALSFIILGYAAPAAEESAEKSLEWSGSVGVFSNYIARGLSQSWGKPVLQAEVDAAHKSGFIFGAFASSLSRNLYPGGHTEIDAWVGYEYPLSEEMAVSVEAFYYAFPKANISKATCGVAIPCPSRPHSFNTAQVRVGTTWHGVTLRLDYSLTDYFADSRPTGFAGSTRGTMYWELNFKQALPRTQSWTLMSHLGATRFPVKYAIAGTGISQNPNYWDWHAGVAKEFKGKLMGWRASLLGAGALGRSFDSTPSLISVRSKDLGKPVLVLGIERAF
ncbi:MAG: hypothetical protein HYR55_02210 [Acidobacteria bacterium]|nr:hypothetical protein [Acidobacteriota bacterium]MBI3655395.1 hypothetical protein [Acidobacteriota bacterium]